MEARASYLSKASLVMPGYTIYDLVFHFLEFVAATSPLRVRLVTRQIAALEIHISGFRHLPNTALHLYNFQLPSQSSLSIIFARRFLAYLATQA
jgi:hypothetical protein